MHSQTSTKHNNNNDNDNSSSSNNNNNYNNEASRGGRAAWDLPSCAAQQVGLTNGNSHRRLGNAPLVHVLLPAKVRPSNGDRHPVCVHCTGQHHVDGGREVGEGQGLCLQQAISRLQAHRNTVVGAVVGAKYTRNTGRLPTDDQAMLGCW